MMSEMKIKQFFLEQEAGNSSKLYLQIVLFTEILQAEGLKV
jgi:hypothetical protein